VNVQELIDALTAVDDKTLPVEMESHCCYSTPTGLHTLPANEPWTPSETLLIESE